MISQAVFPFTVFSELLITDSLTAELCEPLSGGLDKSAEWPPRAAGQRIITLAKGVPLNPKAFGFLSQEVDPHFRYSLPFRKKVAVV